ncbi:MAG: ABC transporter ATP-binding protein [Acholeplasmatales bacterium]|nr:ABC transporter ATP-binding protein [Acholeplasmatales bacterium]
MIKITNVSKEYISGEVKTTALDNVSLEIQDGEFLSILGMSGSGKTTLLNLIGGLDKPTSGEILIDGINYLSLNDKEASKFRNENIGYIFQLFYLEPSFTVFENVSIPLIIGGKRKKDYESRVFELLQMVSLGNKANKLVSNLSGGEKQRVCIARALANDPKYILADEPTGSLDSVNGEAVLEYLKLLNMKNKTIIFITHNEDFAKKYSNRIISLKDGKIVQYENNK